MPSAAERDDSLLREPADRGVRLVALSLLANARKASDALTGAPDLFRAEGDDRHDAVHDFRVRVRRYRSWIRAFKSELRGALPPKRRRALSRIAHATSGISDATAQLEWLRAERRTMGVRQRVGEAWLRTRLETRRAEGSSSAVQAATHFTAMAAWFARRLNVYRAFVIEEEPPRRFGSLLAERARIESESLRSHLGEVHDYGDVDASHRARIAAKRLRYVVEPVRALVSDGEAIIDSLKALQDALGDLHDIHVLAAEVAAAVEETIATEAHSGLIRLTRRLQERGTRAYALIERDWLGDASVAFFDRVRDVAADMERRAVRDDHRS